MSALVEDVLPFFLALYVFDSVVWVRAFELLFVRRAAAFELHRQGLQLVGLLPVAEVVAVFDLPLCFGPGRLAWEAPDGWRELAWDAVGEVRVEERWVRSAGGIALRLASREAALHTAAVLRGARDASPVQRLKVVATLLARRGDVAAVRALRERHLRHARALDVLGGVMLAGTFGVLPLAVSSTWTGWPPLTLLLLGLGAVHASVLALCWRTLRGCGMTRAAALAALVPLFLFPASSAHARSLIGRNLYVGFDPLAVAAVLLPRPALIVAARERYHAARLRRPPAGELAGDLRLLDELWRGIVRAACLDPDEVLRAPRPQDPSAAAYCPACSTEYRAGATLCSDCDAPLLPLGA